ncbi:selenocysteine-specific translation elongation factor [Bacillus aquiflavi]|uniref:Selenocysteine-specific elongation factor n=1 Tax=Bacillus aquiflavi TaxID=2672567 RepID=A0A6B3W0N8_9BACI|nr:selenocysteine-specific translation elongation factor [Bacillus aquiflavi]MBA4538387.1 selenocysteine-specific translation elongation factor [Bacillus aquiflavi]NEY82752.1 selenocysteine-specific translation elongation factor [Bacillus aquiflavi]
MDKRYFTIGMAGHIDHGKTTLTKALTHIDTDRLKEEKERQISIELGFAPLYEDDELQISVIDVPGHERFIRQMIAGVTGIDLVVLVVAADEGVMPQTKEHLDILRFLGVKNGIVAITKIDRVDEEFIELVKDDIFAELTGTVFENAPFVLVDSISGKGIAHLKSLIIESLKDQQMRDAGGAFRLPIDQVFTVKGQGTVVRGTVFEGVVAEGETLTILPKGLIGRVRQIQVHHKQANQAFAGQRTAINLTGISKEDIKRGDVLVSSDHFTVTNTIDVALRIVGDLDYIVKQRMPIKCHIGTAEVMGRIVFFDRNELLAAHDEILCQLRLDEEVVTKRGDRFIIRRPSPQETIGGGWVIDARGEKYRFGEKTVSELEKKKKGTPKERIISALLEEKSLSFTQLIKRAALEEQTLKEKLKDEAFILYNGREYTLQAIVLNIQTEMKERLETFHKEYPLKKGLNKAELFQGLELDYPKGLLEYAADQAVTSALLGRAGQFLFQVDFKPHVPNNWRKRTEHMLENLKIDGMKVEYLSNYLEKAGIPDLLVHDLVRFLEEEELVVSLNDQFYWHGDIFREAVKTLRNGTEDEFTVGEAKDILGLSRKYIIPFLERLDSKQLTKRIENKRRWQ